MSLREQAKRRLRAHHLEVIRPARRTVATMTRTRLGRYTLPSEVAATLHEPGPDAMYVDIDRIVNRAGFAYGPSGWHPYVEALQEHLAEPDLPYESTSLARFYASYQPSTVHDLLIDGAAPGRVLATWPAVDPLIDVWSVTGQGVAETCAHLQGRQPLPHSQYRGPVARAAGAMHLQRTVQFYESARDTGYRPLDYPSGFVTGHFLTRGEDYRCVIGHGNHRVAALRVLGHSRVAIMLRPAHPPVIAHDRLERWSRARGGLLGSEEAAAVFDGFFTRTGAERCP